MEQRKPSVYLFYGDDVIAIDEAVSDLKSRIGDPSTIDLNFLELDGRSASIGQLETASRSLPFIAERRLTVLNYPLAFMKSEGVREKTLLLLENLPEASAIVLAEHQHLLSPQDRRKGKTHWLQKWAASLPGRAFSREYTVPHLQVWLVDRARKLAGEIEPLAAQRLASLIGNDVQLAEQELLKLLTYVNYQRAITERDVAELTVLLPEGGIFDFVDALGNRDQKRAVTEFHRLMMDSDVQSIFRMIVRQFRLLVQSREILDRQGGETEITNLLKVHPFVGQKLSRQARQFSQRQLDSIFHRLLEIESGLKTGKIGIDLSIDLLIAEIR